MIPEIETERLRLRAPRPEDFEPYAAMMMGAAFIGARTRDDAWATFAGDTAAWVLIGIGYWTIEDRATGAFVGTTGLARPPRFPELEFGWAVVAAAEGKGLAFEAASAAARHARAEGRRFVSYIDAANRRSRRLAERLGARPDPAAPRPDPEDVVYRHPTGAPA